MATSKVKQIGTLGQSIWLDFFDRSLMDSGGLQKLILEDGISGITSNPAIFEKAITSSSDYEQDIREAFTAHTDSEAVFFDIAVKDIQRATSYFLPIYQRENGMDGLVSIEVAPQLAYDRQGTIDQAVDLWNEADRKNVMIKIPATQEGLGAIEKCISEGININITLLFGISRYEAVAEAYLRGLEERLARGLPIDHITSVASFFLSRIDVLVDPWLPEKGLKELQGQVAISLAKLAYQHYQRIFSSDRFLRLKEKGARPQKLLWASTSTKNPALPPTWYVDALIGPATINTLPLETIDAFRDHGHVESRLEQDLGKAKEVLEKVTRAGIDLESVSLRLEKEGVKKFDDLYRTLLAAIEKQKQGILQK